MSPLDRWLLGGLLVSNSALLLFLGWLVISTHRQEVRAKRQRFAREVATFWEEHRHED